MHYKYLRNLFCPPSMNNNNYTSYAVSNRIFAYIVPLKYTNQIFSYQHNNFQTTNKKKTHNKKYHVQTCITMRGCGNNKYPSIFFNGKLIKNRFFRPFFWKSNKRTKSETHRKKNNIIQCIRAYVIYACARSKVKIYIQFML